VRFSASSIAARSSAAISSFRLIAPRSIFRDSAIRFTAVSVAGSSPRVLPVPVSPVISTGIDVGATRATCPTTCRDASLSATIWAGVSGGGSRTRSSRRRAISLSTAPGVLSETTT
jgi:hypothetical protein